MLALVIPCYNEAKRLKIDKFLEFSGLFPDVDLYFVNDGSTDKTLKVLQNISEQNSHCMYLHISNNVGKAEAVRRGIMLVYKSEKDYTHIGYADADLATPLQEVVYLRDMMNYLKADFAMSSRVLRLGANIERKWYRHYASRVIATTISLMLSLPVYDSQCGAKMIKKELVPDLFRQPFISRWFFDVEILFRMIAKFGRSEAAKHMAEVPLFNWTEIRGSKIKLKDFFKVPLELLRIYFYYKFLFKLESQKRKNCNI